MQNPDDGGWIVTERPVDLPALATDRHTRLSVAHVTLPDGSAFEQAVLRASPAAMCVLVDAEMRVLLARRHRFVPGTSMWEVPGGYLDDGEDPADCAIREAIEETGWRPAQTEHLCTFEPMAGNAAAPNHVYLGLDPAHITDVLDVNEHAELRWFPLSDTPRLIAQQVLGAATVIGLLAARERLAVSA